VNSTAIIFTWDPPIPSGRNGNITGYSLVVRELITNITTTYSQSGEHIELVVSSLHPFYEYECAIAAETGVGRGPYGMTFVTRTNPDGKLSC
jgi:receptor-type tyrosine-protein phosphatase Q